MTQLTRFQCDICHNIFETKREAFDCEAGHFVFKYPCTEETLQDEVIIKTNDAKTTRYIKAK